MLKVIWPCIYQEPRPVSGGNTNFDVGVQALEAQ
jgi:hypothetical protein